MAKETIAGNPLEKLAPMIPFALFVTCTIGLSFCHATDINLLVGVGLAAILLGALLVRDGAAYWNAIFDFFGSRTAVTATLLWLLVGVYGSILREGHLVDGLVWLSDRLQISSGTFTVVTFLFSGLFAISTGSGFGTISAMSLTLFPAGVAIGGDAALLGGAILSGAALGDSISPVSDTAVIAASTQQYAHDGRVADVGGTVRHRLPVVAVSAVIAVAAYFVAGGFAVDSASDTTSVQAESGAGLLLLLPTLAVMLLAFRRVNIFVSLFIGIVAAAVIGLGFNLFDVSSLVGFGGGKVRGAVVDGIGGMANVCLLLMVVVALSGLVIRSGCMDCLIARLDRRIGGSGRRAELAIFVLTALSGIFIAAVNTIANICVAPFVNSIGLRHGIHPHRRATILATVICTFPFFLPYGGCVLLLMQGVGASAAGVALQPSDMLLTAFYPLALLVCSFWKVVK